jgi:hypothetical protein
MTSKMKSRKFLLTLWAALLATGVMIYSIYSGYDASWMPGTLAVLVAIPAGYVTIGSAKQKKEE